VPLKLGVEGPHLIDHELESFLLPPYTVNDTSDANGVDAIGIIISSEITF
jgi:hypothetical protein